MTLLYILSPTIPPQVPISRGIGVVNKFVKRSTTSRDESVINLRANIFGASNESDALQDNRMKNDHLLDVPFLSLYAIKR